MRQWLEKLGRKMSAFMIGRYGTDELSRFLVFTGLGVMLLSWIPVLRILYPISWVLIVIAYFRSFSKNIIKRSAERDRFLRRTSKIRGKFNVWKRMWHDRSTHSYFKCPNCKTLVRVPKGKGRIAITCTKCRTEFIKTT